MTPWFIPHIQGVLIKIPAPSIKKIYGTITLCDETFQNTSIFLIRNLVQVLQHHISTLLLKQIRFALCCVLSLILAASQLISFLADTKTLQFSAFSILSDLFRKSYSGISSSKTTCIYLEHSVACHSLRRLLSQVIHLMDNLYNLRPMHDLNIKNKIQTLSPKNNFWTAFKFLNFLITLDLSGFEPETPTLQR